MNQVLPITFDTKIVIRDAKTKEVLREGKNAIHPQNMSRVIARALANEPNALIHRIAFGNGGTYTDAAGNVVFNPPNDGNSGGWEARLYNETYSEIVDELHPDFKNDPGSADVNNVRMAGGASPSDDPEGGGVTSVEVGRKSNIVVTMVINENEPNGQLLDQNIGPIVEEDETFFMFDEIGLYAPGRPAKSTSGYSTVNVGTAKTSTSTTNLAPNTNYTLPLVVNGFIRSATVRTPSSGTGATGSFTYGDICEGINSGSWLVGGDPLDNYVTVYITDRSGGAYPSILGMQSYGFLTFESKMTGVESRVELTCDASGSNFFNVITNAVCGNVNVNSVMGVAAGVANDPVNPLNERERLLTHFIFDPILKSRDRAIEIEYTLTVSVGRTADSQVLQIGGTPIPSLTPTPTPSVTPSVTPSATPSVTPSATPAVQAGWHLTDDSGQMWSGTTPGTWVNTATRTPSGSWTGAMYPTGTSIITIGDNMEVYTDLDYTDNVITGTTVSPNHLAFGQSRRIDVVGGLAFTTGQSSYSLSQNGGLTWTDYASPNGEILRGIAKLDSGRWLALTEGSSGKFYYSDQTVPTTWTLATSPAVTTNYPNSSIFSFGSGAFNLASNGGVFRTTDGATWTYTAGAVALSTGLFASTYGATDGNGVWVLTVVGGGAFVFRTADNGLTWTKIAVTGVDGPSQVVFGNGVFVVPEYNLIKISSDLGLTWSNAGLPPAFSGTASIAYRP
jgi:hypothetical protein